MCLFRRSLTYTTLKSKDQVLTNIGDKIFWNRKLGIISSRNQDSFKIYEGFVEKNSFTVRRILKIGANSFIPLVHGEIKKNVNDESIYIQVNLVLQKFTRIFLVIFNVFFSLLLILLIVTGNILNFVSLTIFIITLLSYIITYFLFKAEAKKADEFIKGVL